MVFLEFRLKLIKFGGIYGLSVIHTKIFLQDFQCRPWECVDSFWNSPIPKEGPEEVYGTLDCIKLNEIEYYCD